MSGDFLPSPDATSRSILLPETAISRRFRARGFLPEPDPLNAFMPGSEFAVLDEIGTGHKCVKWIGFEIGRAHV